MRVPLASRPVCVIDVLGGDGVGKTALIEEWMQSTVCTEFGRMIDVITVGLIYSSCTSMLLACTVMLCTT